MDVQVDWKRLKDLVAAIRQQQDLKKPTSSSLRKNLQSPVLQAALMTLTMLDSIALNCGPAVRTTLAERKWMEALLGACAGGVPNHARHGVRPWRRASKCASGRGYSSAWSASTAPGSGRRLSGPPDIVHRCRSTPSELAG